MLSDADKRFVDLQPMSSSAVANAMTMSAKNRLSGSAATTRPQIIPIAGRHQKGGATLIDVESTAISSVCAPRDKAKHDNLLALLSPRLALVQSLRAASKPDNLMTDRRQGLIVLAAF